MPRHHCALLSLNGNANPLFVHGRALRLVEELRALAGVDCVDGCGLTDDGRRLAVYHRPKGPQGRRTPPLSATPWGS
jgi:hypothetical protein